MTKHRTKTVLKIVKCREIPQWIVASDKAAYHPHSNTIYLTKWRYLPHELVHWFACKTGMSFLHNWIDKN